jgi:hypothetical protein
MPGPTPMPTLRRHGRRSRDSSRRMARSGRRRRWSAGASKQIAGHEPERAVSPTVGAVEQSVGGAPAGDTARVLGSLATVPGLRRRCPARRGGRDRFRTAPDARAARSRGAPDHDPQGGGHQAHAHPRPARSCDRHVDQGPDGSRPARCGPCQIAVPRPSAVVVPDAVHSQAAFSVSRTSMSANPSRLVPRQLEGRCARSSSAIKPIPQMRSNGLASTRIRSPVRSR